MKRKTSQTIRIDAPEQAVLQPVTVVWHSPDGDREIAVGSMGQFKISMRGRMIVEAAMNPAVHAQVAGHVDTIRKFDRCAWGCGEGTTLTVYYLAGRNKVPRTFNAAGRAPDEVWRIIELLRPLIQHGAPPNFWSFATPATREVRGNAEQAAPVAPRVQDRSAGVGALQT